jgi:hypothetical protein
MVQRWPGVRVRQGVQDRVEGKHNECGLGVFDEEGGTGMGLMAIAMAAAGVGFITSSFG